MVVVVILSITFVGSFSQQRGRRKALHLHGFRISDLWLVSGYFGRAKTENPIFVSSTWNVESGSAGPNNAYVEPLPDRTATWIVHVEGLGRHTNRSDYVDLSSHAGGPPYCLILSRSPME
jgi:hypothetical protein